MLVPLKPVLDAARKGGYAQGAFNVNPVCQAKAVIEAHETLRSAAILQGADLQRLHGRPRGLCQRHREGQDRRR